MPPSALRALQVLNYAEPFLTLGACLAFRRSRSIRLGAMGAYLIFRLVWIFLLDAVYFGPSSLPLSRSTRYAIYFYLWWIGEIALFGLLLRAGGECLRETLKGLSGILRFVQVSYRWLILAMLLMILPLAVTIDPFGPEGTKLFRLVSAISLAELLVLVFVAAVCLKIGGSARSRVFGILLGLSLEPLVDVINSWFYALGHSLLNWNNLIHQIASDSALIVWIVCFLAPVPELAVRAPSAQLLHWDQIARKALKHRLPPEEQVEDAAGSAEPVGRDA